MTDTPKETVTPLAATAEIKILASIIKALDSVDLDTQRRMIAFINDKYRTTFAAKEA